MNTVTLEFGFLPQELDMSVDAITIASKDNLKSEIERCRSSPEVNNGWIYPGMCQHPSHARRVFGLPKTHTITHANADSPDHLQFLTWCLSFFLGIRLTTAEAGFLDATPIQVGTLVDFICTEADLTAGIRLAEKFWHNNRTNHRQAKRLAAAIHALFLSQYPKNLQFERFIYLYTALDACYALTKHIKGCTQCVPHVERIKWMCNTFSIGVPVWATNGSKNVSGADTNGSKNVPVADLRNDTIHEALFADEPLGFAIYEAGSNTNITLEMKALICRLIVAMLGADTADYVRTPTDTRATFLLTLA